jgi:hypothetical protein
MAISPYIQRRPNPRKNSAAAIFPRSFAKVQRMARVVIEEQFVSFIC